MRQKLNLLGFAAGIAGNNPDCALAPWYLYYHPEWFQDLSMLVSWEGFIKASSRNVGATVMPEVVEIIKSLSQEVLALTCQQQHFMKRRNDSYWKNWACESTTWKRSTSGG